MQYFYGDRPTKLTSVEQLDLSEVEWRLNRHQEAPLPPVLDDRSDRLTRTAEESPFMEFADRLDFAGGWAREIEWAAGS